VVTAQRREPFRRREDVKKTIGIAVALVAFPAVLRRFGPALRDRAMAKCQEMFERSFGERTLAKERENVVLSTEG
jgi:hypothetical protein